MSVIEELGFYHFTKAGHDINNLPKGAVDEMSFSVYEKDTYSSVGAEFMIRWYVLGRNGIAPRLEVFSDSWALLAEFKDLLDYLVEHNGEHISPEELTVALVSMGVVDKTHEYWNYSDR